MIPKHSFTRCPKWFWNPGNRKEKKQWSKQFSLNKQPTTRGRKTGRYHKATDDHMLQTRWWSPSSKWTHHDNSMSRILLWTRFALRTTPFAFSGNLSVAVHCSGCGMCPLGSKGFRRCSGFRSSSESSFGGPCRSSMHTGIENPFPEKERNHGGIDC